VADLNVTLTRQLPAPVDEAYAWLTDFDADDPRRAGALVLERPVVEEGEDHVILESTVGMLGVGVTSRLRVDLVDPPRRWTVTYLDGLLEGSEVRYELEPAGPGASTHRVEYDLDAPRGLGWLAPAAAPVTRWQLDRMWAGFEQAMRRELRQERSTGTEA
jgi:hypothetical protein